MIELFKDGIETILTRPSKGCRVFATETHHKAQKDDFMGVVTKVDGSQCFFEKEGNIDLFLWRFKNSELNSHFYFKV